MTVAEMRELMQLRGWSQAELARQLHVTEGAITRWLKSERRPNGPARTLITIWLNESRKEVEGQPA